jgi:hypothetical protein
MQGPHTLLMQLRFIQHPGKSPSVQGLPSGMQHSPANSSGHISPSRQQNWSGGVPQNRGPGQQVVVESMQPSPGPQQSRALMGSPFGPRSPHTFSMRQHEPFTQIDPTDPGCVWQQVALVPVPHTFAVGQHVPLTQLAPVWQHWVSQGVLPDGHWAHVPFTQLPLQH